jgi:2-dehydro-3-deoxyphosphogluconate aldolase/(4S)-4-hydroxy-2-oxoglutarate aldolase
MSDLIARLEALKVIPVIALKDAAQAVPLARVLVENGLPAAEVTFRTPPPQRPSARCARPTRIC